MNKRKAISTIITLFLVLSQGLTAFAANSINPTGGSVPMTLENKYWYKVRLPAALNLEYDGENVQYKEDYEISVCGETPGKSLELETHDVDVVSESGEQLVLEHYIGQASAGEKNHKYVFGEQEGEMPLSEDWQSMSCLIRHDFTGVNKGEYTGTAKYRFRLVDKSEDLQLNVDTNMMLSAGSMQPISVTLDGEDVTSQINWKSSDESVAYVADNGAVVVSATAEAGDSATISGTMPPVTNRTAWNPFVITANAAPKSKTIEFNVTVMKIEFDNTMNVIDEIQLYPGDSMKIRAIIEPEVDDTVIWSATRMSGLGLLRSGNYCTVTISKDMPEGETFDLIATYGNYSKRLPVKVLSRHVHQTGETVKENVIDPTCETNGSYDEVTYCVDCHEELSRVHKEVDALGHEALAAVTERIISATCTTNGSYDEVVYCKRDHKELLRRTVTVNATGHKYGVWKDIGGNWGRECSVCHAIEYNGYTTYNIFYNTNGGSISGQKTTYNKLDAFYLPTPTRSGYSFVGWTGSNGSVAQQSVYVSNGSTGNKTFVANWSPINYSISYNTNGGTISNERYSYNIETVPYTLPVPTRAGYTFTGWTGTNGSTPSTSVTITSGWSGNVGFIANWKHNPGWVQDGTSLWKIYGSDGNLRYGWITPNSDGNNLSTARWNSKYYYIESNGYAVSGWKQIGTKWYYFDENGSDTAAANDHAYGAMITGWQKVGNYWYYLTTESESAAWGANYPVGSMLANTYNDLNGKRYYFDGEGHCTNP